MAKTFEEFCSRHGIAHTLNSSRHPQAIRTLLPAMIVRTEQGLVRTRELTENCETYRDPVVIREENSKNIGSSQLANKKYYDGILM